MELFDAHRHVCEENPAELLARARAAGVRGVALCGTRPKDWPKVLEWSRADACVIPCFGVHPWNAGALREGWVRELEGFLDKIPSSLGEVGLDASGRGPSLKVQEEVFQAQLKLARERGLAAMIHCVRAWGPLQKLLGECAHPRGFLLHAYSGPVELVEPLARMGAYFSFAPFQFRHHAGKAPDAADRFASSLRAAPSERLLLESDAPNPEDPRGSEALAELVESASRLRGEEAPVLARTLLANARRLFGDSFK
jgi:TatD DNase family protein